MDYIYIDYIYINIAWCAPEVNIILKGMKILHAAVRAYVQVAWCKHEEIT
jgi:hypothetical protein